MIANIHPIVEFHNLTSTGNIEELGAGLIEHALAIEFVRSIGSGRTKPMHLVAELSDGSAVEVVTKFSGGCESGVAHLAREAVCACLAADLGLPIPKPYLVEILPEFIAAISDPTCQLLARKSARIAFGSSLVGAQFSRWIAGSKFNQSLLDTAAAVFFFDAIVQNPDRTENPGGNVNCLVRGDEIRIFDHELCFRHDTIFAWKPPWVLGSLIAMAQPGSHIFSGGLHGKNIDFSKIRSAWIGLSDSRLMQYRTTIPSAWAEAYAEVASATNLIKGARDNIDACIAEVKRVLA